MKQLFRSLFSPILTIFESGNDPYIYKRSHRIILIVMGILFSTLALSVYVLGKGEDLGYLLPVFVFGGAGMLSILIGLIGSNRAVAKIWGSK